MTQGEHGPMNRLSRTSRCSQKVKWQAGGLNESTPGPLHVCWCCQVDVFVGFLTVLADVSLSLACPWDSISYGVALSHL